MASNLAKVDIYNMALDLLKQKPVAIGDGQAATQWLDREYGPARDALTQTHPWNFALKRAELASDVTPPAFGWEVAYTPPSDTIRVLPITSTGTVFGTPLPYVVESNKILCNITGPLKMQYIRRVTDSGDFSNLFGELLATRLAMKMAHWTTGKQNYSQRILELYREIRDEAKLADALEGASPEPYDDDVIAVRSQ